MKARPLLLLSLAAPLLLLAGCATAAAVRDLGAKTASNATLVSAQISRLEKSRRNMINLQEATLQEQVVRTTRDQGEVDRKFHAWKAAGEGALADEFDEYQKLSEMEHVAAQGADAAVTARNRAIETKLPEASGNAAKLEALGKLLTALTPKESFLDTLKAYGAYWQATQKLIDEALKKAEDANKDVGPVDPAKAGT